jgi:GIY-YIG catalytic domain
MHDEILAYLRLHGPSPSPVLAQEFLKFKNPDKNLAHIAVRGILSKDRRFVLGDDGLWRVSENAGPADSSNALSEIPWAAVYFLVSPGDPLRAIHVSAWTVGGVPELLYERWLADLASLPFEEQELLVSVGDTPFSEEPVQEKAALLVRACEERTPLFLSWRQHSLFSRLAAEAGRSMPDSAVLAGTLFACCGRPVPRPLTLDQCNIALFGSPANAGYAYRHGERFALCCWRLLDEMREKGITRFADIEEAEQKELSSFDFSSKAFSHEDIASAPTAPGVYGFKAKDKSWLYIGKATNLRRRLSGYFRESDESPDKLDRIRAGSHELVTHQCGSELESLIYEYRLIRKHSPVLNSQIEIAERKGDFAALEDCVVLLPHAGQGKGMSFWFRKNQKINLRPFSSDFADGPAMESELEAFFFGGTLVPGPTDFPEQEIATRWVKRHKDDLCIVWVNRSASGREVWEMMKGYWKDCITRNEWQG